MIPMSEDDLGLVVKIFNRFHFYPNFHPMFEFYLKKYPQKLIRYSEFKEHFENRKPRYK